MQGALDPIVIKGTRFGLLISIREDADFALAMHSLSERLAQEAGFLGGASVSVDLGWRETSPEQFGSLEATLAATGVKMQGVLSTSLATRTLAESHGYKAIIGRLGLAEHQGRAIRRQAQPAQLEETAAPEPEPEAALPEPEAPPTLAPRDEEPTLLLRKTLRSGQKVIFAGNVVVMGDVNPGAEIEAEGDVVVLGTLRGLAHAGCSGKSDASVMALVMQPTQLRVGEELWVPETSAKKSRTGPMKAWVRQGKLFTEAM
ncbi:septum site-determining protein MinC [bacterium CPR1]|nr:septum site-determining protein MinC [bacterium CPR1]